MAFKPQSPIKTIAAHRFTVDGALVPHEYPLRDNWYYAFAMASDEDSRRAYLESWTSEGGRAFNKTRKTCPRCKGRGATRKDEAIGCATCFGQGSIEK